MNVNFQLPKLPKINIRKTSIIKPIILLFISFVSIFCLSGCVQYDLGVNFNHTNNGQLIQHIKLDDKISVFGSDYISEWLRTLETRARKLSGKVKRISPSEIIVKIPFTNAKELQENFTAFLNTQTSEDQEGTELSSINTKLVVDERNLLLVSRNHLTYDLDLRSLAILKTQANNSLVNLDFSLQVPWGLKNLTQDSAIIPTETQKKQPENIATWTIKPGEINHIEAVFWLPNFLGIGTIFIILFSWFGFYLRYQILPKPDLTNSSTVS